MQLLVNTDDENIEESTVTALEMDDIKEKIEVYKSKQQKLNKLQLDMNAKGIKQVSFTDPESRGMKNNGRAEVCYNIQTAVDSKHNLIVDCDVVNDINDLQQLSNMALNAKKSLRKRKLSVVADTGYYNAEEIKTCVEKRITVYIKKSKSNNRTGHDEYRKEKFKYSAEDDKYTCPEGKNLIFAEYTTKNGLKYKRYKGFECGSCPKKSLCATAKQGRNIQRWIYEDILENVEKETAAHADIYKRRRCIVEHPFGTIKRNLHYTYFMRRGLDSVNAEAASIFVAYNLTRAINILTVPIILNKIPS
jgi:hypothetical protein